MPTERELRLRNRNSTKEVPDTITTTSPTTVKMVTFALTPGQLNPGTFLDYSSKQGHQMFTSATTALPVLFTGNPNDINTFSEKVMDRAQVAGWGTGAGNILDVPNIAGTKTYNIIHQYGCLTMEDVRAHASTYMANDVRTAQNQVQMYHAIMNSLTSEAHLKIITETDKYTVNGTPIGTALFKCLMQKTIIDTKSTTNHLRQELTTLDAYIATVNSDIPKFNNHVKIARSALVARGERTDDLMIQLFRAYAAVTDRTFVQYIQSHKDRYDDNETYSEDGIMTLALNKYENLRREGRWNAPTPEQSQIVALTATMAKIKDDNLKLSDKLTKSSTGRQQAQAKENKPKAAKKNSKTATQKYIPEAWMKVPPKSKTHKEKEYHWCPKHKAWGRHKPTQCRKTDATPIASQALSGTGNNNPPATDTEAYTAAFSQFMQRAEEALHQE